MISHTSSAPHPYIPQAPLQPTTPMNMPLKKTFLRGGCGGAKRENIKALQPLYFETLEGGGDDLTLEPRKA